MLPWLGNDTDLALWLPRQEIWHMGPLVAVHEGIAFQLERRRWVPEASFFLIWVPDQDVRSGEEIRAVLAKAQLASHTHNMLPSRPFYTLSVPGMHADIISYQLIRVH